MLVLLDNENYFTGTFVKIGGLKDGINVFNLPDDLENNKARAYKYMGDFNIINEDTEISVNDEMNNTIEGNINKKTYTKWEFDENKYKEILKSLPPKELTLKEQVTELKNAQATTDEMLINLTYDMIMLQNNL